MATAHKVGKLHGGLVCGFNCDGFPSDCGMSIVYSFTWSNYIKNSKYKSPTETPQQPKIISGKVPTRQQVLDFYQEVHNEMMRLAVGKWGTYKIVLSGIVEKERTSGIQRCCLHDFAESMGWTPGPAIKNGNSSNHIRLFEYDLPGHSKEREDARNRKCPPYARQ